MSELTKQQLTVENNSSFPNNNTGFITPTLLRTFNGNIIDSMVDEVTYNANSASWETEITALQQFSASLDANFVTPTELSASSSTLQNNINTKLSTSSFNAYTASQSGVQTGSLLLTASAVSNVITFTKGDGSTFPVTVGSVIDSSSLVSTASFNAYTQSASTNTSASINAATSSLSQSLSSSIGSLSASVASINASQLSTSSFNSYTASASTNVSASINAATQSLSASLTTTINGISGKTGSYATTGSNTFIGNQIISGNITATSASFQYVQTVYETASIIFSSGSNQFGDELSDTQTLSGSVKVQGSLTVNGTNVLLVGETASYASSSISASFALTSSEARNLVIIARNGNPSSLPAGTVVHITGASGDNPIFNTASYDSELLSANTLGILRTTATSGADVEVLVNGIVTGIDTNPANGYVAGDIIYLGPTGSFTRVQPQAPLQIVTLGQVLRANQNQGSIYVSITNGWELNELHNVAINGVADGDLLVYRSGTSLWTNSSSLELGNATTGSNTFIGNQIISGNLLVTGSNINLEVDAPALSVGTTNVKTIADASASGVPSTLDITRLGAGPTGDLSGIRLQTLSGSDTTGDTLLSRINTGVNRHTSTGMTGSVVNSTITSTWATGSGGTRVAYSTTINANAQSASATLTLNAGNASSNFAGGTASIAAGLIRIGTNAAQTISSTGSFGAMILVSPLNTPALAIRSGSFELTTPQGSGSFYSNCPITSSGLRINGTAIVKDLIVSGTWGGSGSGSLFVENSITASVVSASQYIGFIESASYATTASFALNVPTNLATTGSNNFIGNQSISGSIAITGSAPTQQWVSGGLNLSGSLISNVTDIYTGSNNANFIVTLGSASMASLIAAGTTNPNTIYFVI